MTAGTCPWRLVRHLGREEPAGDSGQWPAGGRPGHRGGLLPPPGQIFASLTSDSHHFLDHFQRHFFLFLIEVKFMSYKINHLKGNDSVAFIASPMARIRFQNVPSPLLPLPALPQPQASAFAFCGSKARGWGGGAQCSPAFSAFSEKAHRGFPCTWARPWDRSVGSLLLGGGGQGAPTVSSCRSRCLQRGPV